MKKIAITGHTQGIGLALYNNLVNRYDVAGFSRSTGYDLLTNHTVEKIVYKTNKYDVLINNAHAGLAQTKLAQLWARHSDNTSHKLIINISSGLTKIQPPLDNLLPDTVDYINSKKDLEKMSKSINEAYGHVRAVNLVLGWLDTDFYLANLNDPILLNLFNTLKEQEKLISTQAVVDAVDFILTQKNHSFVNELVLDNWSLQ